MRLSVYLFKNVLKLNSNLEARFNYRWKLGLYVCLDDVVFVCMFRRHKITDIQLLELVPNELFY